MFRGMRCLYHGSLMLHDYLNVRIRDSEKAQEINGEVHRTAALRMYTCFSLNAGPYIKLGQMVGQMTMLLPDEYCEVFEPMCMQAPRTPYSHVKEVVESDLGRPLEEVFECKQAAIE